MCKPSLTWSLTGATTRMCHFLGYYCLSHAKHESDHLLQRKIALFWTTYVLDRSNALRLGRPSANQDHNIDTPMLGSESPTALVATLKFWVEAATVQGKICDSLYGPVSRSLSVDVRAVRAEAFADELDQIYQRRCRVSKYHPFSRGVQLKSSRP